MSGVPDSTRSQLPSSAHQARERTRSPDDSQATALHAIRMPTWTWDCFFEQPNSGSRANSACTSSTSLLTVRRNVPFPSCSARLGLRSTRHLLTESRTGFTPLPATLPRLLAPWPCSAGIKRSRNRHRTRGPSVRARCMLKRYTPSWLGSQPAAGIDGNGALHVYWKGPTRGCSAATGRERMGRSDFTA